MRAMPKSPRSASMAPSNAGDAPGDTPARLVAAGLKLFSEHGLDGVTTRALAAEAGVNQAAIPYYFGGKEGVYLAVAEFVCDSLGAQLEGLLADLDEALRQPDGACRAPVLLPQVLGRLSRTLHQAESASAQFAFIIGEQQRPTAAFEQLHRRLLLPLHRRLARLLGLILSEPAGSEHVVLTTHALFGLCSSFVSGRSSLQRILGARGEYSSVRVEQIALAIEAVAAAFVSGLEPPCERRS